jgi:hypothetical protein
MFFDISVPLSYNPLFMFIVGPRGQGKTYGSKKWAIDDFKKTGGQFIYLRRLASEIKQAKINKFFHDIYDRYPEDQLAVEGRTALINGDEAGQFMNLSTAKIDKSVPFPMVNKIIFDEFIIDKGFHHYLPDEVINFLELYETIARMRNNVQVIFLSNAITQTNPYFLYFNIKLPRTKNGISCKNDILIQMINDNEFIEAKKNTRFGKLIAGTQYGDYAIDNKFLRDNEEFISHKTEKSNYYMSFKYKTRVYGVWVDYTEGKMFVSNNVDPYHKALYTLTLDDHSPNTLLIKNLNRSNKFKRFIEAYKMGCVYFENMNIKNVMYEVIKILLI